MDAQFLADHAELACRYVLAYLGIPEQPDAFWDGVHTELIAEAAMLLNGFAVMADMTQPIGTES